MFSVLLNVKFFVQTGLCRTSINIRPRHCCLSRGLAAGTMWVRVTRGPANVVHLREYSVSLTEGSIVNGCNKSKNNFVNNCGSLGGGGVTDYFFSFLR